VRTRLSYITDLLPL